MIARAFGRRFDSVQQDWRAILPLEKSALYASHIQRLQNAFAIFAIGLDEALALWDTGSEETVHQEMVMVGQLCARFALGINAVLHAMGQYARHFDVIPNLAFLNPENFCSERGQRRARHSQVVSQILLSERSQLLNKLAALEEIVDELADDFIAVADQFAAGTSVNPSAKAFFQQHYFDLNTCLSETRVLFKSFLLVLPFDQLAHFDFTVNGLSRARRPMVARTSLVRARRIVAVAGE